MNNLLFTGDDRCTHAISMRNDDDAFEFLPTRRGHDASWVEENELKGHTDPKKGRKRLWVNDELMQKKMNIDGVVPNFWIESREK